MRGYKLYGVPGNYIDGIDRILCTVSYLTFGWVGFIWLAITHFRGKYLSSFARYHVIQALFIYILISVFNLAIGLIANIIGIIPFIGTLVLNIIYLFTQYPLIVGFSLFDFIRLILYVYLPITAALGKYGRIPYISDIVKQMA